MRTVADNQILEDLVRRLGQIDGTRPSEFGRDRERTIGSLRRLAETHTGLTPAHFMFGSMAPRDWHRWAYRHISHHLRQFGL